MQRRQTILRKQNKQTACLSAGHIFITSILGHHRSCMYIYIYTVLQHYILHNFLEFDDFVLAGDTVMQTSISPSRVLDCFCPESTMSSPKTNKAHTKFMGRCKKEKSGRKSAGSGLLGLTLQWSRRLGDDFHGSLCTSDSHRGFSHLLKIIYTSRSHGCPKIPRRQSWAPNQSLRQQIRLFQVPPLPRHSCLQACL